MDYWTYKAPNGLFDVTLPNNWSSYDDEPNVHAFFDTTRWTGNLRITHYYKRDMPDEAPDNFEEYIADKISNQKGAERIQLGRLLCAHYSEPAQLEDGEQPLIMYYWMAAARRHRFACSFAAPEENHLSLDRSKTLRIVEDVIASIVLY